MKRLLAVVALLVVAFFAYSGSSHYGVDCKKDLTSAEIDRVINSWKGSGVILNQYDGRLEVDDRRWKQINLDAKISIAITEFCREFPDSRGTLLVRGTMNGDLLGSVVNGSWLSP